MKRRDFVKFIMAAPAARRLRCRFRRFSPLTVTISGGVVIPPAAAGSVHTNFADSWNSMDGTRFSISHGIPWRNTGGDWLDKNGAPQGPTAYLSVALTSVGPKTFGGTPMRDLAQKWVTRNTGAFIKVSPSSASGVYISTRNGTNPPTLSVVAGRVTYTCPCRASMDLYPAGRSRNFPKLYVTEMLLSVSPAHSLIQFDMSSVPVGSTLTSATMTLTVTQVPGSGVTADVFEVNTPRIVVDPRTEAGIPPITGGIAENYSWDVGIENHPDVIVAGDFGAGYGQKWIDLNPNFFPPAPDAAYWTYGYYGDLQYPQNTTLGDVVWPGRSGAAPNSKARYQADPGGPVSNDPRFGGRTSLESYYIKEEDGDLRRSDSYGSNARIRLVCSRTFSAYNLNSPMSANPKKLYIRYLMIHKGDPPGNQGVKYGATINYKPGYMKRGTWSVAEVAAGAGTPPKGQWCPEFGHPKQNYPAGTTTAVLAGWPMNGVRMLQLNAGDWAYWLDPKIGTIETRAKCPGYTLNANYWANADVNGEILIDNIEHSTSLDASGNRIWVPGTGEAWTTATNVPHDLTSNPNGSDWGLLTGDPMNYRNGVVGKFIGGSARMANVANYQAQVEMKCLNLSGAIRVSNSYPNVPNVLQAGDKFWIHILTSNERSYTYTGSPLTSDSAGEFVIPAASFTPALVTPIVDGEPFDCSACYARQFLTDPNPLRKYIALLNYVYDVDFLSSGARSGWSYPTGDHTVGFPMLAQDKVYSVEIGVEMNTVRGPYDVYGNGTGNRDGKLYLEVDGVPFLNKTDMLWTHHPEHGFPRIQYDSTLGGQEFPRSVFKHGRVDGPWVVATRRIGPPRMPTGFPAWRQAMITSYAVYNVTAQGVTTEAKYTTHPTYKTYPNSIYPELQANAAMAPGPACQGMLGWGTGCISEEMGAHGTIIVGGNGHNYGCGTLLFPFDLASATWGFPLLGDPTKEYFAATMANPNPPAGTEIFFDPNFAQQQAAGNRPGYVSGQPPPPTGIVNWNDPIDSVTDHHNRFTHLNYNTAAPGGFEFDSGVYLPNVPIGFRNGTVVCIPSAGGGEAAGTIYVSPNLFGHTASGWSVNRGSRFGLTTKSWLPQTTNSNRDLGNPFAGTPNRAAAYSEKYKKIYATAGGNNINLLQVYNPATNAMSMVGGAFVNDGPVYGQGQFAVITNGLSGAHLMITRAYNNSTLKSYLLVIDLDAVEAGNFSNAVYTLCPPGETGMGPHALPILTGTVYWDDVPWNAIRAPGDSVTHLAWAKTRKTLVLYHAYGIDPATQLWTRQTSNPYTGNTYVPDARTLHTIAVPDTNWKTTNWVSTQRPLTLGGGCKGLYHSPTGPGNGYGRFQWSEKADCCLLIQGNQEPVQAITLG